MQQDRLVARIADSDVRYVYIVGQTGAGKYPLLARVAQTYGPGSMCVLNDWDALAPQEAQHYRELLTQPSEGKLIVATATDPSAPNPFAGKDPTRVAIFTDADLAYTVDEIAELFEDKSARSFAEFAFAQTGGHTGTITFMRRVLRSEGECVARDLSSSAYAPMRRFLYERVVAGLPPEELAVLVTGVAIDDFSEAPLRQALPASDISSLLGTLAARQILTGADGALHILSMFRAALEDVCRGDLQSYVASLIDPFLDRGNYAYAARVAVRLGRPLDALTYLVLETSDMVLNPDAGVITTLRAMPEPIVSTNARTWAASWSFRRLTVDAPVLIAEAQTLLACAGKAEDASLVRALRASLGFMLSECGRLEEADAQFEIAMTEPDATVCALFAASLSTRGDLARATDVMTHVREDVYANPSLMTLMNDINKRRARFEGNWDAEKTFLIRAVDALPSGQYNYEAVALSELASGATLARDSTAYSYACERLRTLELRAGVPVERFATPLLRAHRCWMDALQAHSADEARTRLAAALEALDNSGWTFGRMIVRVSLAQLSPDRRIDLLREASGIGASLGPRVAQGLQDLIAGNVPRDGHLRAAALHFGKFAAPADEQPALSLCITKGTVERGGAALSVSRRVFDLLVALAVRGRPVEREELCAMLWPDEDTEDTANALKMTVRRARTQTGDPSVICTLNGKYSLGAHVACDVRAIRGVCEAVLRDPVLLSRKREEVSEFCVRVTDSMPHHLSEYEWFTGTQAALETLAATVGEALGIKIAAA